MSGTLDRLEALCGAATPGPWEALDVDGNERAVVPWVGFVRPDGDIELIADCEQERGCQDAEFIAASRAALPALIAVARAAERVAELPSAVVNSGSHDDLRAALAALEQP